MSNKQKHLDFIQRVITRMNSNSFAIKGWTVALISALFALSAKDADESYALVAYIPLIMFWILDAFFLSQEKKFRSLYDFVRYLDDDKIDFAMSTKTYDIAENSWCATVFSRTLILFYGFLFVVTLIVMFLITQ